MVSINFVVYFSDWLLIVSRSSKHSQKFSRIFIEEVIEVNEIHKLRKIVKFVEFMRITSWNIDNASLLYEYTQCHESLKELMIDLSLFSDIFIRTQQVFSILKSLSFYTLKKAKSEKSVFKADERICQRLFDWRYPLSPFKMYFYGARPDTQESQETPRSVQKRETLLFIKFSRT